MIYYDHFTDYRNRAVYGRAGVRDIVIRREEYLEILIRLKDKHIIKVMTGVRRCGKSTMFELYREYLLENNVTSERIISVNLEDGDYRHIKTAEQLYEYVAGQLAAEAKYYVFLDEVQQVEQFEKAVDWLYVKKNVDLYITGSNAFLLSGELATLLSGRYIEIKMLPLSFREYVSYYGENGSLAELFSKYLTDSSFPGTLELAEKQDIRMYLEGIYHTILLKDIVIRNKIADSGMLQSVIEYVFDNIGNLCSSTKIAGTMTSAGRKISVPTVESYLEALTDSFIIYKVGRYDIKGKQYLATGVKYYVTDIGLRYYLLGTKSGDMGHILENIVYLELRRRGYEIHIGKAGTAEIDFIAINGSGTEYYQVAQTVMDENTLRRELAPLLSVKDHNPKYLLTMDHMPPASHDGIRQLDLLRWLMKEE